MKISEKQIMQLIGITHRVIDEHKNDNYGRNVADLLDLIEEQQDTKLIEIGELKEIKNGD